MKGTLGAILSRIKRARRYVFARSTDTSDLITPFSEALIEIERRRNIPGLRQRVEHYLKDDLPIHFSDQPILYLARHVATPNFETLRFLHLLEPLDMRVVVGQDLKDKFVPKNHLKKALGKLSVLKRLDKTSEGFREQYEHVRIVDFDRFSGKPFNEIETEWGEGLPSFHNRLFSELLNRDVSIVDDSEWIDRHHRGRLLTHYKKFLSLFIVHGILFEDYVVSDPEEQRFIAEVLRPAFLYVERKFGYKPLITELTPTSVESPNYWIGYPAKILEILHPLKHPQN